MKNVGSDVGRAVGAGVGTVDGTADGTAVNIAGADVSSSRRAPSRRPLDRRAFGPLRGGRCPKTLPYLVLPPQTLGGHLSGRPSHLIEAAKRGRLDQMLFFGAADDPQNGPRTNPERTILKIFEYF